MADHVIDIDVAPPMTLDELADKDYLTVRDVRYLREHWPQEHPDIGAANLATRVKNAPEASRFLTFETMNLLRLYQLQHQIITYASDPEEDLEGNSPAVQVTPLISGGSSTSYNPTMPYITAPSPSQMRTKPPGSSQTISSGHELPSRPKNSKFSSKLEGGKNSQPLEGLTLRMGKFDPTLSKMLQEYNEALVQFRQMQSWPRANKQSTRLARSDFAFHFQHEKYITSRESMYDLSPAIGPSQIDGLRQWLMAKLPLKWVNRSAWNERQTLRRNRVGDDADSNIIVVAKHCLVALSPLKWINRDAWTEEQARREDLRDGGPGRSNTVASLRETHTIPQFVDDLARFMVSIGAALFLLVPMIVLSFITSQRARLGTTVAFVVLFVMVLGRVSNATNDAIMGATAAYAAVLVVFVGQTTPIS